MDTQSHNLTIPRGSFFFAKFKPNTQIPGPRRQIGNCLEGTLTRNAETLDHYSSQSGLKVLDKRISITSDLTGTVTTDDIKSENLAYFFMGDVSTITATALTAQSDTFETVAVGDTYQLGQTDANPTGHRKVNNVVVTDDGAGPTTFVLGDDYTVDEDLGMITIVEGSAAAAGNIVVTYDVTASTREQIIAADSQIEGELLFVSDNPEGSQGDILIPRATISANGDFALVNDPESTAFQTLSFTISALKKGNLALAYRDGRPAA